MNKKFKRALSSILAFVMVISVLTVMNVTSAFAATTTWTLASDTNFTGATMGTGVSVTSGDLTFVANSDSDSLVTDVTYPYLNMNGSGSATGRRFELANCAKGDTITITYTSTSDRTITVYENYSSSSDTPTVEADSLTKSGSTIGESTYTYTTKAAGTALFYFSNNKFGVVSIARTDAAATDDYTLTGSVSGDYTEGTFTVSDGTTSYNATVAEGSYSFTASVEQNADAPYSTGDSFTVTAPDGYTVNPTTVSITAYDADSKTYTLDAVSFTEIPTVDISGTVTATDGVALPTLATVVLTSTSSGDEIATAAISSGAFAFEGLDLNLGEATVSISGADSYTTTTATVTIGEEDITGVALTTTLNTTGGLALSNEDTSPNAKYTFTSYSGDLLIDPSESASTPYYYSSAGYSDNLKATLDTTNGLTLYDNDSKDTLYVNVPLPYAVSTGTVTIEATVNMPTQNGSWSIMTLCGDSEFAALRSNSNKVLVGMLGSDSTSANSLSGTAYTAGDDYAVKMVVDYDNNTVETYVDNTLINTLEPTSDLSELSYIMFRTAGGTRTLYVKSLSVSVSSSVAFDSATNTITGLDGTVYYVVPVTTAQQSSSSSYTLSDNDDADNYATGDVVYNGVSVDGTDFSASELGSDAYAVAFIVSSTTGIDTSALNNRYTMSYTPIDGE